MKMARKASAIIKEVWKGFFRTHAVFARISARALIQTFGLKEERLPGGGSLILGGGDFLS